MKVQTLGLMIALAVSLSANAQNLLTNPGFETLAGARPQAWEAVSFRTGGKALVSETGAHTGTRAVVLESPTAADRACWRQRVSLPDGAQAVAAGGWYRSEDFADTKGRGVSLRVHFFQRSEGTSKEISLKQTFFPASEAWTEASAPACLVPAGATEVELQIFNWLIPGKTFWDDAWLRVVPDEEMASVWNELAASLGLDREPVRGTNVPYSPADGSEAGVNPPPFCWLPASSQGPYNLQVSSDPEFSNLELDLHDWRWCAYMHPRILAPGVWYWRYGVSLAGGTQIWSRSRSFSVTGTAPSWPYPEAAVFAVPEAHPRLFIPAARLPEIRARAADGDLAAETDALVRTVSRYAGEELVLEPAWLPEGKDRGAAYTLTFRATRPPMDRMEQAAFAYLLSGDRGCAEEARRRILHFFSWDPHGPTNVFHNDEPAMWIMMRGVRAYDWTYDCFTADERASVETAILERARDFYKKLSSRPFENNPYESHAGRIIGFLGEAALLLLPEHEEAGDWLQYITTIYWGVYPAWGKEDGGWNEGPGYWSAYMSFALHFVVALREATGIDLSQRPFFRHTPYYKLYLTPPYSTMSPFGDGTQYAPSRPGALMYWFSSLLGDRHLRWYTESLGQGADRSVLGVVLRNDALTGLPPCDLPPSRYFPGVGMVSLHTHFGFADDDVIFTMKSSPYGAVSHGHNDQNCFTIEGYGEPLAIATGHYNRYGSPHHSGWTRQTKAKCGITIDGGQGQDRGWQAQGSIEAYVGGSGFDYVRGNATPAYGGRLTEAVREVLHIRPGVFVIRDRLASETPRTFEFWLHALDEMAVDEEQMRVVNRRPKASLITQFLAPEKFTFEQTDAFDVPPTWPPDATFSKQWHLRAANPVPATEITFVSVLMACAPENEGDLPTAHRLGRGAVTRGVELMWPDGRRLVVYYLDDLPGGTRDVGGAVTDAEMLVLGLDNGGKPERWLVRDGSLLTFSDEILLEAQAPGLITASRTPFGMQVDSAGSPSRMNVWCHDKISYLRYPDTLSTERVRYWGKRLDLDLAETSGSLQLWRRKPAPVGPASVRLKGIDVDVSIEGCRGLDGQFSGLGIPPLPSGRYRCRLPDGCRISGGIPGSADDGDWWYRSGMRLYLSTTDGLESVPLDCLQKALPRSGIPRESLPDGFLSEAENGWTESGGSIQVSGGGHAGTSGNNNLWGWNTPGHRLNWRVTVPAAGRYRIWLIGADETGFLGELELSSGMSGSCLIDFASTGGWGRKNPAEWQAFCLSGGEDESEPIRLNAGELTISLTNRSGVGLNVDAIVLVGAEP